MASKYDLVNPLGMNDVNRCRKFHHLFFVVIFSLSVGSGYKSVVKPLADIIRFISVKTALQAQNINDL